MPARPGHQALPVGLLHSSRRSRIGGSGEVLTQSLRARLANIERCADGKYLREAISREFSRNTTSARSPKRIDHNRVCARGSPCRDTRPWISARSRDRDP